MVPKAAALGSDRWHTRRRMVSPAPTRTVSLVSSARRACSLHDLTSYVVLI